MAEDDSMCDNNHRLVVLHFMHQLDKMSVNEGLDSNPHRLFAFHLHETRIAAVGF
jgi:hypothetical protein